MDIEIVPKDRIPSTFYETPLGKLTDLYVAAQGMESLCKSLGAAGLSAPQVGLPWNLFVYWSNYPDKNKKFDCLIDCAYSGSGTRSASVEGCLSLSGMRFKLDRYDEVVVTGKRLVCDEDTLRLEGFTKDFSGFSAAIIQHEIDHSVGRERMIDAIGERIHLS
jgi:peptide deformylase